MIPLHYFTESQLQQLFLSLALLISAILFFNAGKQKYALLFLFLGSLGLGFFVAHLDPYLNIWDEQYHALVAKNMMQHPFYPTLYEHPLLDYDYTNWTGNSVWVHKQPLFLWQMALSMKLFGVNELAIRIPSIVLHALTALLIFRIGKISNAAAVGFYAALIFTVAYYPLEMMAGKFSTDHNDFVFMCYITASFWAWFEYMDAKKTAWLILIGLFAGCAVLVKWLPGLLVFAAWAIALFIGERENRFLIKTYYPLFKAATVAFLVFIPWQVYIFYRFPLETQSVYLHNVRHFKETVDGHSGGIWFHFNALKILYGSASLIPVFILGGIYILLKTATKAAYQVFIASAILITYLFFTIASTKMVAFCMIVAPFIFLGFAALTDLLLTSLKSKFKIPAIHFLFSTLLLIALSGFLLNLKRIERYHTNWKPKDNLSRQPELNQMAFISKLNSELGQGNYVVFNANVRINGHIAVMFYTDYVAYDFIPSEEQIKQVSEKKYKIAIRNSEALPAYIKENAAIVKINL